MFTNREFCRYMQGQPLTPEQGAEAVARLRNVLNQLKGLDDGRVPLVIKALQDKAVKSAAADICEGLCNSFEQRCRDLSEDVVSPDDLINWLLDNGEKDKDEFSAADMVNFAAHILEKYGAEAAGIVYDDFKDAGEIVPFSDYVGEVRSQLEELAPAPVAEDVDLFDPIDAARDTGAPLLFTA